LIYFHENSALVTLLIAGCQSFMHPLALHYIASFIQDTQNHTPFVIIIIFIIVEKINKIFIFIVNAESGVCDQKRNRFLIKLMMTLKVGGTLVEECIKCGVHSPTQHCSTPPFNVHVPAVTAVDFRYTTVTSTILLILSLVHESSPTSQPLLT
jgi:hypothetical protein